MKKLKKYLIHIIQITIVISVVFFFFSNININENKKEVKVGIYEYGSYYFFDKGLKPSGYYNDLLKLISNKLGFKYTYVNCKTQEGLDYLKNGKIDLLFGLSKTPDRASQDSFEMPLAFRNFTSLQISWQRTHNGVTHRVGANFNRSAIRQLLNFIRSQRSMCRSRRFLPACPGVQLSDR